MADYQPSLTAAIQIGKKTHTGRYHRDIYAKLTPEERAQAGTDGRQFGFVDEAGKYLHRATAMQYARDMGLLHPKHADTKSPHLIAEMLADRPQRKKGGGLYANIHAKQERIAHGSKERMRKPGAAGAPSATDFRDSERTARNSGGSLHWEDEPPSAEAVANDARRAQLANPHHTPAFTPNLPHDPTSREKRATELGYTHHGFHGTRADVPAFDPRMVDVGTHIGTDEQANQRLKHTRKWNDDTAGENVIPVRAKLGKSFEMPDVGAWNDSVEVMNHMVAHGARMNPGWRWPLHMTDVLGRTIDKRDQHQGNWKRGDPDWEQSPENKHALSLINTHLQQNGYGSIKYHNIAENLHGAHPGMTEATKNRWNELNKIMANAKTAEEIQAASREMNELKTNPKHHNDRHSYIVLDPAHLRSRFAQFDPARAHEPDLLAAKGGFMRKPRADGGSVNEDAKLHTGPIHSPVAGRTDHLPMHVPSGSYVIPADIIGAMGEGNTMAGFKHVRRMFGGIPYGNQAAPYGQDKGPYGAKTDTQPYDPSQGPYQSELPGKAHGGSAANHVAIVAAGGEYVLTPDEVRMAGDGDLERGHRVLDEFIKRYRQKTIKTLQKLPGPARD